MYLEVITPEEVLFKGEVSSVQLPGKDGLFQILNNHAPLIATLALGNSERSRCRRYKNLRSHEF